MSYSAPELYFLGIQPFFPNKSLGFNSCNLNTFLCIGAWTNCDYTRENSLWLHKGLFCAALTMYSGAPSLHFPRLEGSSLRGGENVGKYGNSFLSKLYFTTD